MKLKEEIKPIVLTFEDGKVYTLEFSRKVVRQMAEDKVDISEIETYPILIYDLFYYAFKKNHPLVTKEFTSNIIDNEFGGIAHIDPKVVERLAQLYYVPFETLSEDETKTKNSKMTISL